MYEKTGISRRRFNQAATAAVLAGLSSGCSSDRDAGSYSDLADATWQHTTDPPESRIQIQRELIRYATLAPNSHNTQPWLFRIEPDRIVIQPDFRRRVPVVDPDDHHLFVSLGCAAENVVLAAAAFGLQADVSFADSGDGEIVIDLSPGITTKSELFQAIPLRQSTRAVYDGKPLPVSQTAQLIDVAETPSVAAQLFTEQRDVEAVLEYVVAGNTAQVNDDAFVEELKASIRFSEQSAVEHRDGLFSATTGNPTMPNWIGNLMFGFVFSAKDENDKYRDQLRSSAGVIALISATEDKAGWINVGRSCQRFALQATALGVKHAYVNQPVEVPEVRRQFSEYLGIGDQRPDLLIRFGVGPTLPRSLRRPVADVII